MSKSGAGEKSQNLGTRTSAHLRYKEEEGSGGERGAGRKAEEEGVRGVGVMNGTVVRGTVTVEGCNLFHCRMTIVDSHI